MLLEAAAIDSTDRLALPRLRAAKAALGALRSVSKAASDILGKLPSLMDRVYAAESIHTKSFLALQAKVNFDLERLMKNAAPS